MNLKEIESVLDEKRREFDSCTIEEALAEPVNADRFYRFVSTIKYITGGDDEVHVKFEEPVPGATNLEPSYEYTVSVGHEYVTDGNKRCEMPRKELITLQQIAIVIWAMRQGLPGESSE
jgi:hypothetical protein